MIHSFLTLIPVGILQGLILGMVALGVMIPFRFLNFPDLSAEGSYPLGGVLCASLLALGLAPIPALICATIAAGCLGIGTALVHLRFRVNTLLAGIILSIMVYSVNLRLMGKPNLALFEYRNIFSAVSNQIPAEIFVLLSMLLVLAIPLFLFLNTESGLRFRAVGLNQIFAESQAVNLSAYTIFGLFIGNALCGLAGSLMVQLQNYADISMGVGIVIHALAGLMIGESLLGTDSLAKQLISPILGALVYQQIQGAALALGLVPSDLKLLTGAIVLAVIAMRGKIL